MDLINSEEVLSDEEDLQEAFAKGELKPGLNIAVQKRTFVNNVSALKNKLKEIQLQLPWLEQLSLINPPAPMAPEIVLQMQQMELRRANEKKGNKKLPDFSPENDPILNDFRRETMFHRQAQNAVIEGIGRLKKLNITAIIRPDDYFAEMAKSDEHMQKVRQHLMKKQTEAQRSEKVRQLRLQRKVGKQIQLQVNLKKQEEKKKLLHEVQKYKKGKRADLDFLNEKKSFKSTKQGGQKSAINKRTNMKNQKYGFGGKKRGNKKNTRDSAADVSEYKRPAKPGHKKNSSVKRPGKNRRVQMKAKKRN